jgi:hypothetical protein
MNFDAPDRCRRSLYCRFTRIRGNSAGANSCSGFVRRRIDKFELETAGNAASVGDKKIESAARYFGIEVDDALAIAEQVDV